MSTFISVLGLILIAVLSILVFRTHRKNQRLEELLTHNNDKLERLQMDFGRFTPSQVIESLTDGSGGYRAEIREVTILFSDLRDFTKMCANLDPETIVSIINGYFHTMSEAITANHGQVTELTGDGVLALFGALGNNPWQATDAVKAAIQMRENMEKYNLQLDEKGLPSLNLGIGIHQGDVLAGVMGNRELSKFGVVGDAINTTARIESLTKVHQCDVLVSANIAEQLDERFKLKEMPSVNVKGKSKPIRTFQLLEMSS